MRLPALELPPDTLVLYELVPAGPDRSGGFRFAVCRDGRFLHANNGPLHVAPERLDDSDRELFWSAPLEEVTRFDADALARIRATLDGIKTAPAARAPRGEVSEEVVERFTATLGGRPVSATAFPASRPDALQRILEAVEQAAPAG